MQPTTENKPKRITITPFTPGGLEYLSQKFGKSKHELCSKPISLSEKPSTPLVQVMPPSCTTPRPKPTVRTKATGVKKSGKGVKAGDKKSKERNPAKELITFPRQATIKMVNTLHCQTSGKAMPSQFNTEQG